MPVTYVSVFDPPLVCSEVHSKGKVVNESFNDFFALEFGENMGNSL